jgi:hypothetical protein
MKNKILTIVALLAIAASAYSEKINVPTAESGGTPIANANLGGVDIAIITTSGPVQISSAPVLIDWIMFPGTVPFTVGTNMFYLVDSSIPVTPLVFSTPLTCVGWSTTTSKADRLFTVNCATSVLTPTNPASYPGATYLFDPYPPKTKFGLSVGLQNADMSAGYASSGTVIVGFRYRNSR